MGQPARRDGAGQRRARRRPRLRRPHRRDVSRALRARAPEKLARYDEVARLLTGRPHATAPDGVAWISELCQKLEIPSLRTYGVAESDLAVLVEKAGQASSMKGNPIDRKSV